MLVTIAGSAFAGPQSASDAAPGFAPADETVFTSLLALMPPGPDRAARSLGAFDRQLEFQRRIALHPEFTSEVRKILDQLPPRQGTLIRAASLYSRPDIPWARLPNDVHQICVSGGPDGTDYLYALARKYQSPETPEHMAGAFSLKPSPGSSDGYVRAVDGQIGAEFLMDTYGAGAGVDFIAALLRFIRGDLHEPWDTTIGVYNHHDKAAMEYFHTDMPALSRHIEHYLKIKNAVDEFSVDGDPVVLFNLDADVQADALKPFPALAQFYRSVGPALVARSTITDPHGNRWLDVQFERGRVRMMFMVRDGSLVPFDESYRPAGTPLDLAHVTSGTYRTENSLILTRMKMTFGLNGLKFTTHFRRDQNDVELDTTMDSAPDLVAPPGVHKVIDMIAGDFLRVLAQGDGGFKASFVSHRDRAGLFHYAGAASAEFSYAPTLELLARVGDAVADAHSQEVKNEERQLGQELFDAFVSDYNNARPKIIALDKTGSR